MQNDEATLPSVFLSHCRAARISLPFDALAFFQKEKDVVNAVSAISGGYDIQLLHSVVEQAVPSSVVFAMAVTN